jgi:hypothetical protein
MRDPEGGGLSGETRSGTATGLHSSGDVMSNSVVLRSLRCQPVNLEAMLPRRQDEERASCAQRCAVTALHNHHHERARTQLTRGRHSVETLARRSPLDFAYWDEAEIAAEMHLFDNRRVAWLFGL